jgi:hypothetical protein
MNYFNLEENVIIQGKLFTEFNGMDAIVTYVSDKPELMECGYVGYVYKTNLDTDHYLKWHETSLRKKYKPSTESLSAIIKQLNMIVA